MAHRFYNSERYESGDSYNMSIPGLPNIELVSVAIYGETITDSETETIPVLPDVTLLVSTL